MSRFEALNSLMISMLCWSVLGMWHALIQSMENRETKILLYTFAATFVVLLALALTSGGKTRSLFGVFGFPSDTSETIGRSKLPTNKYRVVRHQRADQEPDQRIYKNEYRPHSAFASSYQATQEVQHPLIASAKFISKKDKLAAAKKRKASLKKKLKKKNGMNEPFDSNDDDFFEDDDTSTNTDGMMAMGNGAAANAASDPSKDDKKNEEEQLDTYEFWENPIFVQEDIEAVQKLIQSYQVRKVSNGVFYDLVEDMARDERANLRQYGLMALTATPSSKSFTELAWMKHNDTMNELRSNAGKEIVGYTNAVRVPYVVSTLSTSTQTTPKASLEALSVLTATSKKYASLRANHNTGPGTLDTTNMEQLASRLDGALRIITDKYVTSTDPLIQAEANKTVAAINDFISL